MMQRLLAIWSMTLTLGACGSVQSGSDPEGDGDDGGDIDHRADGGAVDPDAPTVLSVSPADGVGGVAPDAHITVVFSQPMDAGAVVAAWRSEELPAGAVSFSWNEAGDTLTVAPDEPLPVAEGSADDPDSIEPLTIAFTIGGEAVDAAGEPLDEPLEVAFRTMRRLSRTIAYHAPLSDCRMQSGSAAESATSLYPGDTSGNVQIKLVLSFALPEPPPGGTVESATLSATQANASPGIYGDFGDLGLVHIRFAQLSSSFSTAALGRETIFSDSGSSGGRSANVTGAVADDVADGEPYTQFRLAFPLATDGDDEFDVAPFTKSSLNLSISYLAE